jgi:hypothetical protein
MAKTLAGALAVSIVALLFAGCGREGSESVTATTAIATTTTLQTAPLSEPLGLAAVEKKSSSNGTWTDYKLTWSRPQEGGEVSYYNVEKSVDGIKWETQIVYPSSEYGIVSVDVVVPDGLTSYFRVSAIGASTSPYASLTVVSKESLPDPQLDRFAECMGDRWVAAINGRYFSRDCATEAYG